MSLYPYKTGSVDDGSPPAAPRGQLLINACCTSADPRFHMSECEKWESRRFCRTLAGRDCALLLLVLAATLAYRRQHVVLGRDSAVVGPTVLVEECVVLGTRIGTYI